MFVVFCLIERVLSGKMKGVKVFVLIVVFVTGVVVGRYQVFPYSLLQGAKRSLLPVDSDFHLRRPSVSSTRYTDTSQKVEVSCENVDFSNSLVALAFGQSNAANTGETRYTPKHSVFNFYRGKCYLAADPLLGATSDMGTVWSRLGDLIVEEKAYSSVVFIVMGVGGSSVSDWASEGELFGRIESVQKELDVVGIAITHLFWHQGEIDARIGTTTIEYKKRFLDMLEGIRGLGIKAPLYLALASRCEGPVSKAIQSAQLELIRERDDILKGANTDVISDMDDRYDFCHFSDSGLKKHAESWMRTIE